MYIFDDIIQEGEQEFNVRFIKLNEKEHQVFLFNSFENAMLFLQVIGSNYIKSEKIRKEYKKFTEICGENKDGYI